MFGLRERKIKESVGKQIHFVQEAATTNKKADKKQRRTLFPCRFADLAVNAKDQQVGCQAWAGQLAEEQDHCE